MSHPNPTTGKTRRLAERFFQSIISASSTIRVQMALAISLFSLLAFVAFFVLVFTITHKQLKQQKVQSITEEMEALHQVLSRKMEDFDYFLVEDLVKMSLKSPNIVAIKVDNEFKQEISFHTDNHVGDLAKVFRKPLYSNWQPTTTVGEITIWWIMPKKLIDTGLLQMILVFFGLLFTITLATLIYHYLAFSIAKPLSYLEKKLTYFDRHQSFKYSRYIPREIQSLQEHYLRMARKVHKQMERFETLANTDMLTQLPNRSRIERLIQEQIVTARNTHIDFSVLFLDLDHFKRINDVYGHGTGDQVLLGFSNILKSSTEKDRVLARFGGDEFIMLIKDATQTDDVIKTIYNKLDREFIFSGRRIFLSSSIGVANYPDNGGNIETLLKNADIALYQSKYNGRNRANYFSPEMKHAANKWLDTIDLIRSAIKQDRLVFHWQAIYNTDQEIECHELLLRLVNTDGDIVSPDVFLPVAEESGLMQDIAEFTCKSALKLLKSGKVVNNLAINFSHSQLMLPGLDKIIAPLIPWKNSIIIEVTEEAFLGSKKTKETLINLRKKGFTIALDDFGSGYSSLALLLELPIDIVKLDKDFQKNIQQRKDARAMLKSIIEMLQSLGKKVVAEGIQNKVQYEFAIATGCDYLQGYYFNRPTPTDITQTLAYQPVKMTIEGK